MSMDQLSMRKLSLSILFFTIFPSKVMAASVATDSTLVPVPTPQVRYWTCTNTRMVSDGSDSGFWWADLRMGDQYTQCYDAGSNPSNSIVRGIVAWGSWSHNALIQGKGRLLCAHIEPRCGYVTGAAPNVNAP